MNYIVFDLEFNQYYNPTEKSSEKMPSSCPFEIIQLGAIKLDNKLNFITKFNRYIKPEIYTKLSPYITKITGITEETLADAPTYDPVFKDFIEFIGNERNILCVWGKADIKELFRNLAYHNLDITLVPKEYIDLQKYASKYFNCPKGILMGLKNAVELLNISLSENFHDALSDASYTAEVFKKINNENIIPKLYEHHIHRIIRKRANIKIDFNKLFIQFQKMYNREMTDEEKSIIKLSYMMGKTNQFHK
jgi:DNA polymerase III epsilon subunit-like protein